MYDRSDLTICTVYIHVYVYKHFTCTVHQSIHVCMHILNDNAHTLVLYMCTESETTTEGVHSEEDRRPMLTPDTLQALPAIDFSNLGDFARRFERQSWRERHEEERRRLKERFEVSYTVCTICIASTKLCYLNTFYIYYTCTCTCRHVDIHVV